MNIWKQRASHISIAALLLVVACTDSGPQTAASPRDQSTVAQPSPSTETTTTTETAPSSTRGTEPTPTARDDLALPENDGLAVLPIREGPRRDTTGSVPHMQLQTEPVPAVDAELRRRVYLITGIEERESQISLPGARSLWLAEDLELERPEVLQVGREFGHFHPDGSLHLWMPVDRAQEVDATKWGEFHPWVDRNDFWDGVVMIYIPETADDADIAMQLVVDAYNNIVGTNLETASFE